MGRILNRISQFIENEHISIGAFERKINASKGVLSRAINNNTDIQAKWLEVIVENYPQLCAEWLLRGEGSMLNTTTLEQPSNTIETPLDSTERSKMLDTISTQAHIIERLQLKIESLERLLSQNEA